MEKNIKKKNPPKIPTKRFLFMYVIGHPQCGQVLARSLTFFSHSLQSISAIAPLFITHRKIKPCL